MTQSTGSVKRDVLVVLLTLRAELIGRDSFIATRKQVDGAIAFANAWRGRVRIWMEPALVPTLDMDRYSLRLADLPYEQVIAPFDETPEVVLRDAAVVLCGTSHRQNHIPAVCRRVGVPCVNSSEYTLLTRLQIVAAEEQSLFTQLRRSSWELRQEIRQRNAISLCQGLQANGTPTYDAYAELVASTHLYFDTRMSREMMIGDVELEYRLAGRPYDAAEPLRLAYSGRLAAMKGVQHLPAFASTLRALGEKFTLEIFGDGPLMQSLADEISARELGSHVYLRGAVPFAAELVPHMQRRVDLFICPHVQGDPSCTYIETMGCGVPVLGFSNEAFRGVLRRVPAAGGQCTLGDATALATLVASWAADRAKCAEASRAALAFARMHTFEETFSRRIDHLREVADAHSS